MTGILPEDGAVCVETRRRDLINNDNDDDDTNICMCIYIYIYSTVCVHLIAILKI